MTKYAVTLTGRTGWDGHMTEQRYEVEAETPEAAIVAARREARIRNQFEHAHGVTRPKIEVLA